MKKFTIISLGLTLITISNNKLFTQAPTLGTAANFVLFTSVGAVISIGL